MDKLLLFPGHFSSAAPALNSIIAKMKTTLKTKNKKTKRVVEEDALVALSPQESLLYPPQSGSDFFFLRVGLSFIQNEWRNAPHPLKKKKEKGRNPSGGYEHSLRFWRCGTLTVGCLLDCSRTLGPPNDGLKVSLKSSCLPLFALEQKKKTSSLQGEPAQAAHSGAAVSYALLIPESCAHTLVKSSVSICRCFFFSFPPFSEGI